MMFELPRQNWCAHGTCPHPHESCYMCNFFPQLRLIQMHDAKHAACFRAGSWMSSLAGNMGAALAMPAAWLFSPGGAAIRNVQAGFTRMQSTLWSAQAGAARIQAAVWSARGPHRPSQSTLDRAYAELERELAVRDMALAWNSLNPSIIVATNDRHGQVKVKKGLHLQCLPLQRASFMTSPNSGVPLRQMGFLYARMQFHGC